MSKPKAPLGVLRARSRRDSWKDLWEADDDDGSSESEDADEDGLVEEKVEITPPTSRAAGQEIETAVGGVIDLTVENTGSATIAPLEAPDLNRRSSLPLLSAGPYLPRIRRHTGSQSVSEPHDHQQPVLSTPKRAFGGSILAETQGTPPRPTHRHQGAPRLGLLQNAQDLASASSSLGAFPSVVDGSENSPRMAEIDLGDHEKKVTSETPRGSKRDGSLLSPPSVMERGEVSCEPGREGAVLARLSGGTSVGGRDGGDSGGGGGEAAGWHSGGGVAEEARRFRARANSFIQRLPGPRKIMQDIFSPKDNVPIHKHGKVGIDTAFPSVSHPYSEGNSSITSVDSQEVQIRKTIDLVLGYISPLEDELDVRKIQLTTQSEPIILMEIMPAAMVVSLILLTYTVFASGIGLIVRHNLQGMVTVQVPDEGMSNCRGATSYVPDLTVASGTGCVEYSPDIDANSFEEPERYAAAFYGNFAGMSRLYGSVSMYATFANDTALADLPHPAIVDLSLEACTEGTGDEWGLCPEGWAPILSQSDIPIQVRSLPSERGYTFFNFYQNQETIRGQPLVRQYRVQVGFVATIDSSGASAPDWTGLGAASWSLEYETGATEQWARIILACVLAFWLPVWTLWCYVVFYCKADVKGFKNALHERKWLAFLGLSVALYVNPIMVIGNFIAPGSAAWGLASEISLSVGVAVFLVVVLCIADGVRRDRFKTADRTRCCTMFYAPKVAVGALTLVSMLLLDLMTFPSQTSWDRSPLLAVHNWPASQRRIFVMVASARVALMVIWGIWVLCKIYISGSLLRQLPYVPTRYQQLSYRFFGLQAFLLGVVYLLFSLWRIIEILRENSEGNTVAAQFMLFIKTRQDHLGSVSILCAYALQLLLLFLPASLKESALFRDIAVRFVYFEAQLPLAKNKGHERRNGRPYWSVESTPGGPATKVASEHRDLDKNEDLEEDGPLFCVETAAWLLELAWETYNDPEGFDNPNKYHFGISDFGRVGFELVKHIFNAEHDTHCFVLKDQPRGRLVIAFRGSVGTKHWMDNLRFLQTEFNLDRMAPKGKEEEVPAVLGEDIDIQAAETLRDVVAQVASEDIEDEGKSKAILEEASCEEALGGTTSRASLAAVADGNASVPSPQQLLPPARRSQGSSGSVRSCLRSGATDPCSPRVGRASSVYLESLRTPAGDGEPTLGGRRVSGGDNDVSQAIEDPAVSPSRLKSTSSTVRSHLSGDGSGMGGGDSAGGASGRDSYRSEPISPSGIRAILKGFSLLPWQFRGTWDSKIAAFSQHNQRQRRQDAEQGVGPEEDDGRAHSACDRSTGRSPKPQNGAANNFDGAACPVATTADSGRADGGSNRGSGSRSPAAVAMPSIARSPWLERSYSLAAAPGSEEQEHQSVPRAFAPDWSGSKCLSGHRQGKFRRRSVSFDDHAMARRHVEGAHLRWAGTPSGRGRGDRRVQASPGVIEGLGRGLARRGEDFVRGTEAGLDVAAKVARRGLVAADNAAHVMGINRIPVLRQYLWGQVHTGFWNSYSAVRGEIHASVRKIVVDWLLSEDHPPDIKIYVTGHSMGGALGTHCAMDLKLHTIDKINARLGTFVRVRRTLLQRVIRSLPGRLNQRRQQHQRQHQQHGEAGGRNSQPTVDRRADKRTRSGSATTAMGVRSGGASQALRRVSNLGRRLQKLGSPLSAMPGSNDNGTGGNVVARGEAKGQAVDNANFDLVKAGDAATAGDSCDNRSGHEFPAKVPGGPGFGEANVGRSREDGAGEINFASKRGNHRENLRRIAPEACSPRDRGPGGSMTPSPAAAATTDNVDGGVGGGNRVLQRVASSFTTVASVLDPRNLISSPHLLPRFSFRSNIDEEAESEAEEEDGLEEEREREKGSIELHMFSFGAPRVGNTMYAARYDDVVPHSFRVVVDGDPVPGVPSWWYRHVGTKVLIDGRGRGSLIMDPSFVEKRFFVRSKRYVLSHLVEAYQAGLRGNLLQAVPPEIADSLPAHWPFGVPASGSSSFSSSSGRGSPAPPSPKRAARRSKRKKKAAAVAASMSSKAAKQDDLAQHAAEALAEAEHLNRRQSFRIASAGSR